MPASEVLLLQSIARVDLALLIDRYGLELNLRPAGDELPGSYWGESEAGLKGRQLYVRMDTPVHSALHEACHYVCVTPERRVGIDTDAGGDDVEESAVCYLQILLADHLPRVGRERMMRDMDSWGYTFRLGAARTWFIEDAEDARAWLMQHELITADEQPTFRLRE